MGWEWEKNKTDMGSRPCREKAAGLRPAPRWGRKAPDPFSWLIAHQTRRNLGSNLLFLLGRNGHDGAGGAWPDPLLPAQLPGRNQLVDPGNPPLPINQIQSRQCQIINDKL